MVAVASSISAHPAQVHGGLAYIHARHKQSAEDHLVERTVRTYSMVSISFLKDTAAECAKLTPGKEAIQLHQQPQVYIVAFGGFAVRVAHMVLVETRN